MLQTMQHLIEMCRVVGDPGDECIAPAVYFEPEHSGSRHAYPPAAESGYEGVACVDDAARLLVLLLSRPKSFLKRLAPVDVDYLARGLLRFVLKMQAEDGTFANFILDWDGRPNRTGVTSAPGGLWWSGRALRAVAWAAASGLLDKGSLQAMFDRGVSACDLEGRWDQESLLMWAVLDYEFLGGASTPLNTSDWVHDLLHVAEGPILPDGPDASVPPHLWGRTQELVVARVAEMKGDRRALERARSSCHELLRPLAVSGFSNRLSTLPYEVASTHRCLLTVAMVARDAELLRAATRCVDWFWGRNAASQIVIEPATGWTADGLDGGRLSMNSGAESNIEALFCTARGSHRSLVL
jgi:hypothetical protein